LPYPADRGVLGSEGGAKCGDYEANAPRRPGSDGAKWARAIPLRNEGAATRRVMWRTYFTVKLPPCTMSASCRADSCADGCAAGSSFRERESSSCRSGCRFRRALAARRRGSSAAREPFDLPFGTRLAGSIALNGVRSAALGGRHFQSAARHRTQAAWHGLWSPAERWIGTSRSSRTSARTVRREGRARRESAPSIVAHGRRLHGLRAMVYRVGGGSAARQAVAIRSRS